MLQLLELCVHLLAVIAFVGYIFFDVLIYKSAYKNCDASKCDEVKKGFSKAGGILLGLSFILILASGYLMLGYYDLSSFSQLFSTNFGLFLCIKLALVLFMLVLTVYSIFDIRVLKHKDPFKGRSHIYALILCVMIVVLAVLMSRL